MYTVFDESEIDDLAKKSEYKKIKVSLREDGRLSSYVKVKSLSVFQVMDGEQFSDKNLNFRMDTESTSFSQQGLLRPVWISRRNRTRQ